MCYNIKSHMRFCIKGGTQMSNRKTNNFRSCATCQIRVCDKNRNKNEDSSRPMIEKNIINEIFKRKGCPYDAK